MADNTVEIKVLEETRNVQMNERVSETEIQIVHPETNAYQVITNENRRFVSEEEKRTWNEAWRMASSAVHYVGQYKAGAQYKIFDMVYHVTTINKIPYRGFFIYYDSKIAATLVNPNVTEAQKVEALKQTFTPSAPVWMSDNIGDGWVNIDFNAYMAQYADKIKITKPDAGSNYFLAFASGETENGSYRQMSVDDHFMYDAKNNILTIKNASNQATITLNGSTGVITANKFVGVIDGNASSANEADEAHKYIKYQRDTNGNIILTNKERTKVGSQYIEDDLLNINKRLDGIADGTSGAVLSNGLIIQKNEVSLNGEGFTGREKQTVNITFSTEEISDLLNPIDKKIADKWLPDTILGAMTFCGIFDASTGRIIRDLKPAGRGYRSGDYLIASVSGNLDPSGTVARDPDTAEPTFYQVGDWAVFTNLVGDDKEADTWVKIDNTDAVRTVNHQIGNVETYKGVWSSTATYYGGDIVYYNGSLYLCATTDSNPVTGPNANGDINDSFVIFGRIYEASDGIELVEEEGHNVFKHIWKDSQATDTTGTPVQAEPLSDINIDSISLHDKYGHVENIINRKVVLPDDTWRAVELQENGNYRTVLKQRSYKDAEHPSLRFKDDRMVQANWDSTDKSISLAHKNNGKLSAGTNSSGVETSKPANTNNLYLGKTFKVEDVGWDKYGHIISKSTTFFTLPTDLYKHRHFTIKQAADGTSEIRALTEAEYLGLKDEDKLVKFFESQTTGGKYNNDGVNKPLPNSLAAALSLNGILTATNLYQIKGNKAYRAYDESVAIYEGFDGNNNKTYAQYSETDNSIILADIFNKDKLQKAGNVYSAIKVNSKGLAIDGGAILEFGTTTNNKPSSLLVIGGLFFKRHNTNDTNGA